jgi:hypothetical protein
MDSIHRYFLKYKKRKNLMIFFTQYAENFADIYISYNFIYNCLFGILFVSNRNTEYTFAYAN